MTLQPCLQVINVDNCTASPSVLLVLDSKRYLFNAGEGIQRHFIENKQKMRQVSRTSSSSSSGGGSGNRSHQQCGALAPVIDTTHSSNVGHTTPATGQASVVRDVVSRCKRNIKHVSMLLQITSIMVTRVSTDTLAGLPGEPQNTPALSHSSNMLTAAAAISYEPWYPAASLLFDQLALAAHCLCTCFTRVIVFIIVR
jgi:hypothetical protein